MASKAKRALRTAMVCGVAAVGLVTLPATAAQAYPSESVSGCVQGYVTYDTFYIRCYTDHIGQVRAAVRCFYDTKPGYTVRYGVTLTVGKSTAYCPAGTSTSWNEADSYFDVIY
ncbi:hypothetical protein [Longispora urticae]